ncbi:MAG: hypothetical protein SVW57_12620 [Thermodesulfobacteriota bacterium]|nr:hypothetical protein [Thermodesulfobacteriota bacterium]
MNFSLNFLIEKKACPRSYDDVSYKKWCYVPLELFGLVWKRELF